MKFSLIAILFSLVVVTAPMPALADVSLSISIAPPELPVYQQPVLPGDGYIWTPGYWAYSDEGYYWVPGTWVMPPQVGYLWTPGYWGWNDNFYVFHAGYWGQHVGYYGGVNYGYGYGGHGYQGGRWDNGRFSYNRTVNHINITNVHNSYRQTVVVANRGNRTSYNGGTGGLRDRPNAKEISRQQETHVNATPEQMSHEQNAHAQPALRQSANHGKPPIAATPRASAFTDHGAVPAKGNDARPAMSQHAQGSARDNGPASHDKPVQRTQAAPQQRNNVQPEQQRQARPQQAPAQQHAPPQQRQPQERPQQEHQQQSRPQQEQRQEHQQEEPRR